VNPASPASAGATAIIHHANATGNIIAVAGNYIAPPTPATGPLHQLPLPPDDFTGRSDELAQLLSPLRSHHLGAVISGLHGMGGVGKTALALVLANTLKPDYPDAQFFLNLKATDPNPLSPADAIAQIIHAYHPEARLPDDLPTLRSLYLSALDGQRAILLLDNAFDRAQIEPLLPPSSCVLIVTTRNTFALPGAAFMNLNVLPEPDACELLKKIAPRIAGDASTLARLCGRLPLALRAAGSLLQVTGNLPVPDYIRQLEHERTRLQHIGKEGVDLDLEACFNLSYQLLPPDTARVFRELSVFPATFDSAAEEPICQDPDHQHLTTLLRHTLVNYDPSTDRYHLHDLLRLFAASRPTLSPPTPEDARCHPERSEGSPCPTDVHLPSDPQGSFPPEYHTLSLRHAAHYLDLLRSGDDLYKQGHANTLSGLKLFDLDRHNIQSAQSFASAHAETDDSAAQLASDYPTAGAYVLSLRLHPQERIHWLQSALSAARRLKDRQAEGTHLGNLGLAHADLGDPRRAIDYYEQALKIDREIGDRRGEGNALGNLGNAHAALGDPRRAIDYYEQCLTIHREIGDRHGEGNDLGNLASAYYRLGDPRRAIDYYEQQLTIAREIGDRRAEGIALGNLGNAHAALGDPRRAIDYYEQRLVIAREIGDRLGYAQSSWNLGDEYAKQGNLPAAIPAMQLYVDYLRELNHPDAEKDAAHVESLRANLPSPP